MSEVEPQDNAGGKGEEGEEGAENEGQIVSYLRSLRHEWSTIAGRTITQEEAASQLGLSRVHLANLESGRKEMHPPTLARLCYRYSRILGREVTPGDILGFEPPKNEPAGTWAIVGVMA